MSAETVIKTVQTLLDELGPDSDFDKDYIINWLLIANKDLEAKLEAINIGVDTATVILPSIPAETSDLSDFQQEGQPLANLMVPRAMRWRLSGEAAIDWAPVKYTERLVDVDASTTPGVIASISSAVDSWTWIKSELAISPCNQIVDLEMRGQFLPAVLDADSAEYVKGADNVLAYKTAEKIARSRGGATSQLPPWFADDYKQIWDDFSANLIKANQAKVYRFGGRRNAISTYGGMSAAFAVAVPSLAPGGNDTTTIVEVERVLRAYTLQGTLDGANLDFAIPAAPPSGAVVLSRNGLVLTAGVDYTLVGVNIHFLSAPQVGDVLTVVF